MPYYVLYVLYCIAYYIILCIVRPCDVEPLIFSMAIRFGDVWMKSQPATQRVLVMFHRRALIGRCGLVIGASHHVWRHVAARAATDALASEGCTNPALGFFPTHMALVGEN